MELDYSGDNVGNRGSDLSGLVVGSMLNRDDGKTSTMMIVLAVVFFVIIFIIALVFLAMAFKDKPYDRKDYNGGTDIAALLTPLIAAKSMESNGCKNGEIDKLEIMQKLEHNEDRAEMRRVQEEQNRQTQSFMQLGFGLSGQMHGNEKTSLENFAKLENQIGTLNQGMSVLLMKENNRDIISGVIQQLSMGMPCHAKC